MRRAWGEQLRAMRFERRALGGPTGGCCELNCRRWTAPYARSLTCKGTIRTIRSTDCEFSESACRKRAALATFSRAEGNDRSIFSIKRKGAYEPLASPFGKLAICAVIPPNASLGKAHLATNPAKPNASTGKAAKHGTLPPRPNPPAARLSATNEKKAMRGYPHRLLLENLLRACASMVARLNAPAWPCVN